MAMMVPPGPFNPSIMQTLALLGWFLVMGIAVFSLGIYYKRRGR